MVCLVEFPDLIIMGITGRLIWSAYRAPLGGGRVLIELESGITGAESPPDAAVGEGPGRPSLLPATSRNSTYLRWTPERRNSYEGDLRMSFFWASNEHGAA